MSMNSWGIGGRDSLRDQFAHLGFSREEYETYLGQNPIDKEIHHIGYAILNTCKNEGNYDSLKEKILFVLTETAVLDDQIFREQNAQAFSLITALISFDTNLANASLNTRLDVLPYLHNNFKSDPILYSRYLYSKNPEKCKKYLLGQLRKERKPNRVENKLDFSLIDSEIRSDREIMLAIISKYCEYFTYANATLQDDEELALIALREDGSLLWNVSERLQDTESIVSAAVCQNGLSLRHASSRLKTNPAIIREAIKNSWKAIQYIPFDAEPYKEYVLLAIEGLRNTWDIQRLFAQNLVDRRFLDDPEIVKALILQVPNYQYKELIKEDILNHEDVAIAYVQTYGLGLQDLNEESKDCVNIVLEAVRKDGLALQYASERLQNDPHIVNEAIRNNPMALQYANERFKDDFSVVLSAVRKNGLVVQFASKRLKDHLYIAQEAVKQHPFSLQYATDRVKNNEGIALAALKQNFTSILYIGKKAWLFESVQHFFSFYGKKMLQVLHFNNFNEEEKSVVWNKIANNFPQIILFSNLNIATTPRKTLPDSVKETVAFSIGKIHKPALQNLFDRIVSSQEDKITRLYERFSRIPNENSLPWHIIPIALSLLMRFSPEQVQLLVSQLRGKQLRGALRDINSGLLQNFVELLLTQVPGLTAQEILLFFQNLPVDDKGRVIPKSLSRLITLTRFHLNTTSLDMRTNLTFILHCPFPRNLQHLLSHMEAYFAIFLRDRNIQSLQPLIDSNSLDRLLTYFQRQIHNQPLHDTLGKLIECICNNTFHEERYREDSSSHILYLATHYPQVWSDWKEINYCADVTNEYEEHALPFSFITFLNEKAGNNHIPEDIISQLQNSLRENPDLNDTEQSKEAEEIFACVHYLKECLEINSYPSLEKIEEGIALFKTYFPKCEFVNDLLSLLPQKIDLAGLKIELTDRWEPLLGCGTDVAGSCQRVDGNPDLNCALPAYILDGKNMLLRIYNSNGKTVGRVFLRFFVDKDKAPCLFQDFYYGADHPYLLGTIHHAAKEIARQMHLPLYTALPRSGITEHMVSSLGSSVPFEYSDGNRCVTNGMFSHYAELVAL